MSGNDEFAAFLIPTIVGVLIAIFSVRLSEWATRRRLSELEISFVLLSASDHSTIELRFKNVGKHEVRDCFAEWVEFDDRVHEKIAMHRPLNWTDNVDGDFHRTLFPNQSAYIELTATSKVLSKEFANQIIRSAQDVPDRKDGSVTIELSWHSGQMSRIEVVYLWSAGDADPLDDANIASAIDKSFQWRNRFKLHNVSIARRNN